MKPVSLSLLLRNLFFTLLQPGVVAGLVPFWIVRKNLPVLLAAPLTGYQYLGLATGLLGFVIMLLCILRFATDGQGTLSPADPTKRLVVSGLYRYSRNPMYVGVSLILAGESIFCRSLNLWVYSLAIFVAFNLFIILREEPRLQKDFGNQYDDYRRKVRRWL
ncbi:methyltransferase family protein [Larkinella bovis]|uniref:Methyltransferase family protein n=1 Tax=Larkinella bovis TaxID=683041 RepID=A0ABW0IH21_9BACT